MLRNFVETHVGLYAVHLVLEVDFAGVLVCDYTANVSYNSGKEKDTCRGDKWSARLLTRLK